MFMQNKRQMFLENQTQEKKSRFPYSVVDFNKGQENQK